MLRSIGNYFDTKFYIRFALLFLTLYCAYTAVIGVTTPSGTYYRFVDNYLNFPAWIRFSVLSGGKFFLSILGYSTYLEDPALYSADRFNVLIMGWPCYGLMIKSFWIAYVVAHALPVKKKMFWCFTGVLAIYLLNCIRVMVMMLAMVNNWSFSEKLNTSNHDLFNYIAYLIIFIFLLYFNKKVKPPITKDIQTVNHQTSLS